MRLRPLPILAFLSTVLLGCSTITYNSFVVDRPFRFPEPNGVKCIHKTLYAENGDTLRHYEINYDENGRLLNWKGVFYSDGLPTDHILDAREVTYDRFGRIKYVMKTDTLKDHSHGMVYHFKYRPFARYPHKFYAGTQYKHFNQPISKLKYSISGLEKEYLKKALLYDVHRRKRTILNEIPTNYGYKYKALVYCFDRNWKLVAHTDTHRHHKMPMRLEDSKKGKAVWEETEFQYNAVTTYEFDYVFDQRSKIVRMEGCYHRVPSGFEPRYFELLFNERQELEVDSVTHSGKDYFTYEYFRTP